jgi:galactose mutarotase-like enzyme
MLNPADHGARNQHGRQVFAVESADGRVRAEIVPEFGGIVSALRLPGPDGQPRECLYRHAWFWDAAPPAELTRGGIPVLFPVCGRLLQEDRPGLYRVDGQAYVLPIHGFAMRQPWEVARPTAPMACACGWRIPPQPAPRILSLSSSNWRSTLRRRNSPAA